MPIIGVCTSAMKFNIQGFLSKLGRLGDTTVKFIPLPYNDLDGFRLDPSLKLDGLVLCHSIDNRRFAITDVPDALYDKFLPYATSVVGSHNITVIAHDFPWPLESERMDRFRIKQPTTFQCSSLAMICGKLDTEVQMYDEDWQNLETFLTTVQKFTRVPSHMIVSAPSTNTVWLALVWVLALLVGTVSWMWNAILGERRVRGVSRDPDVRRDPKDHLLREA